MSGYNSFPSLDDEMSTKEIPKEAGVTQREDKSLEGKGKDSEVEKRSSPDSSSKGRERDSMAGRKSSTATVPDTTHTRFVLHHSHSYNH